MQDRCYFCTIHSVSRSSLTEYVSKSLKTLKNKSAPKADAVSVITYFKCCHDRNDEKAVTKKKTKTRQLKMQSKRTFISPAT